MLLIFALPSILFFAVWGIAEYQNWPMVRRCAVVGAAAVWFASGSIFVWLVGLDANSYYRTSTNRLISASYSKLRAGQHELVLSAWEELDREFEPGYETRGRYEELVIAAVKRMEGR